MKGIIFTEFMQLVEDKFGLAVVDQVLDQASDPGIYTSVGYYDHRQLVKLIMSLSQITNISPEELQQVFGECVFENLLATLPENNTLSQCKNTFQFIRQVEDYIHVEVKKLYPQTNPPQFTFISESSTQMVFDYHSARCMSAVCFGLIQGCANHFDEKILVTQQAVHNDEPQDDGQQVRFSLEVA